VVVAMFLEHDRLKKDVRQIAVGVAVHDLDDAARSIFGKIGQRRDDVSPADLVYDVVVQDFLPCGVIASIFAIGNLEIPRLLRLVERGVGIPDRVGHQRFEALGEYRFKVAPIVAFERDRHQLGDLRAADGTHGEDLLESTKNLALNEG
jgi:hypothetical protein